MAKKASRRELINTGTDKRYVRRDEKGRFKESDDVGRSLSGSPSGRQDEGSEGAGGSRRQVAPLWTTALLLAPSVVASTLLRKRSRVAARAGGSSADGAVAAIRCLLGCERRNDGPASVIDLERRH